MSDLLTRIDRPGNDRFDVAPYEPPRGRWYAKRDGKAEGVHGGVEEEALNA